MAPIACPAVPRLRGLAAAAGLLFTALPAAATPTVTFRFEPPQIEAAQICARRAPDPEVASRWEQWDGTSLAGQDPDVVRGEIRRLRDIDVLRWYDKLDRAIGLLPTISPGFTEDKVLLERIDLMLAAGRSQELQALGLVDRLAAQGAGSSPRTKLALSRLLRRGQGVESDPARGLTLLVEAAYGGNADAILEIVSMQLAGESVPDWNVSPELAVTMAFGALVGQLDPMICDRVTRIAREYKNGDVVTRDIELAERWYRFAADLGDGDAAWKVAELHLRGEELSKDNDVLLRYLERAADQGTAFMALAYGRVFENGALVTKDLDKALQIYETVAASGDRGGLLREAQFLSARLRDRLDPPPAEARPALEAKFAAALDVLVAREDAPAWALVAKAEAIQAAEGRWAGAKASEPYLERAAAQGDGAASQMLSSMHLSPDMALADFYGQIDAMIGTVRGLGMVDPMADLQDAFICRAPDGPRVEEAAYWHEVEYGTGTLTVNFDMQDLKALVRSPAPLEIARLQSQALYGRPTAVAQYLAYLRLTGAPQDQQAFWKAYATRFEKVASSLGGLYLDSGDPALVAEARALLSDAVAGGDASAELTYARALLSGPAPEADRAKALELLLPHARRGEGAALRLLPKADPARWPDAAAVAREFRPAIDAGGDFEALVFALPHLADRQAVYLSRAATATNCTFEEATAVMDALAATPDRKALAHWSAIAEALTGDEAWKMTALADRLLRDGASTEAPHAMALYHAAWAQDYTTAGLRLLSFASDAKGKAYDPAKAVDLYAGLVEHVDAGQLVTLLERLRKEDDEIVQLAAARIDPARLYQRAAEAGEPAGMREYGLIRLKDTAPEEAALWISRAAEAGDGEAMVEYAQLLALGIGVETSREEALVWLHRAADQGVERASLLTRSIGVLPGQTQ